MNNAMAHFYIPTEEKLEETVRKAVDSAVEKRLPDVIQKATRKKYLTTKEACEYLGITRRSLYHLKHSGQIEFSQHGRKVLYPVDALDAFIENNRVKLRQR